jgi:hypothetical protein
MRMPKIIIQVCQYNYNVLLFLGPPQFINLGLTLLGPIFRKLGVGIYH